MAYLEKQTITVPIDSTSQTVVFTQHVNGFLHSVRYDPSQSTFYAATADFKLETTDGLTVCMTTAVQLTTAGWSRYPRMNIETAAGGSSNLDGRFGFDNERLRLSVYNGNTTVGGTGTFKLLFEGVITS